MPSMPWGLFIFGYLTKMLYAFLISPMQATCPTQLILLDLITLVIFGVRVQIMKLLTPHLSWASLLSLLGPNMQLDIKLDIPV
jgi:hypothetical protein